MCSSRKKSILPPWKVIGNSRGEEGVLKAKLLKAMYENKPEFSWGGGGGTKQKTFRGGSMDIIWNYAMWLIQVTQPAPKVNLQALNHSLAACCVASF